MIPNANEVSAFAVYSGLVGTSKSRQRRNRLKRQQETIKVSKPVRKNDKVTKISNKPSTVAKKLVKIKTKINKKATKSVNDSYVKIVNIDDDSSGGDSDVKISNEIVIKKSGCNGYKQGVNSQAASSPTTDQVKPTKSKKKKRIVVDETSRTVVSSEDLKVGKKRKGMPEHMIRVRPDPVERKKLMRQEVNRQVMGKAVTSSIHRGKIVFESLISPFSADEFFSEYWEKKPLHLDRGGASEKFSQYLSTTEIDEMLRYNVLMFGRNLDITSYDNGTRETHNPEGRAHPHIVWDYFSNGCSVRVLNPQTYLNKVHTLLAALQEYFGCFVGSNIYLTPAGTQGFAPHYDDIEAFVLQVEGSKRWRVYNPRCEEDVLARLSSRNFDESEIGEAILDVVLRPGDLLYFPRGFIHQAEALPDQHSLHITVSTYQKTTWLDLIQQALPVAMARAGERNVDYRRGLPIGYLRGAGLAHPTASLRSELKSKLCRLVSNLDRYLDLDDAVDKMALTFVHQSLPPVLSTEEAECSVHNGGLKMSGGEVSNKIELGLQTRVRWIRANTIRLVEEEGECRLYYSVDNSKEYEAEEPQYVVFDKENVPAALHLLKSYPAYTPVSSLPCSTDDHKIMVASDLWERGLLISDRPLQPSDTR